MLIQLSVENIAIIEKLTVELEEGLNILTGETGAGKSILIDAINALLGGRVSREIIRTGADKAKVEALMQTPPKLAEVLDKMGIENQEDDTLIISRRFSLSGKNICRINGTLVTVSQLREIGEYLIDIHGQYDNQSLLRTQAQSEYLDMFSGHGLLKEKKEYQILLGKFHDINRRISEMKTMGKERARLEDLYRYQSEEISAAQLQKGEERELSRQSNLLSNTEGIMEAFHASYCCLSGEEGISRGALELVQRAQAAIGNIAGLDPDFYNLSERLIEVIDKLEEITREVRQKKEQVNYDPILQQEVEERLALIEMLKHKYGNTIEEIIAYGENAREKLEQLTDTESVLNKLCLDHDRLAERLYEKACHLHKLRVKAASILKERVTRELRDLEMPNAEFQVGIQFDENRRFTGHGLDSIEFLISPNPGEGLKPLNRIASGGEMSRVMLAIKTILADIDEIGVLIFDEIDTGVSGKAALKVGEKLIEVSKKHQVICITHHAQIASLAKAHYFISKSLDGDRTAARMERMNEKERETEIARLLSGENSDSTKKLAREMLKRGAKLRSCE